MSSFSKRSIFSERSRTLWAREWQRAVEAPRRAAERYDVEQAWREIAGLEASGTDDAEHAADPGAAEPS